jgi:hypothetical protein
LDSEPPLFDHLRYDKPTEISWSKQYETESGHAVCILTTGKPGPFPVAGYILTTGGMVQWDKHGKTQNVPPGFDLVEVRP